ncbi:hypothetical protein BABINDRAFT_163905 [Babjeviella inositovora NRRL Y-12698]|uniref:FAD-binding FR-type domain-containing protein n=1 Tax=Babjeviella inositovora NRRL Y-12698 TaxID=984486 RepID=A0A1E3QHA1_9ASCO|nr:uncharacterized protein BABINDRAFT_163905 [Babjeviella inositovora NRRL Y-12698]ODQ77010.1 hypothetical protein BABINDRAFT_163905 [Babjeviella inositovora NRRL Y-12698]
MATLLESTCSYGPGTLDAAYHNASSYAITPISTQVGALSYLPVTVNESTVGTSYQSYRNLYNNNTLAVSLGAGFVGFFGCIMLLSGIFNWTMRLFPAIPNWFTGSISIFFRRHVSLTAAFKKDRNVPLRLWGYPMGLIPTRLESFVVLLSYVYLVLACAIGYTPPVENNPIFPNARVEIGRHVANRIGTIALFIYPLAIIFAGRNNVLLFITRWNYSVFNMYHRHLARIFLLLTMAHGASMTITLKSNSVAAYMEALLAAHVRWGIVSVVVIGLLAFQSVLFLRRRSYETFLLIHITLAVVVLLGVHFHAKPWGFNGFTWAVIAIWCLDRVIRLVRMFSFGIQEATVTIKAEETLKVTVPKPRYWKAKPGQYSFVSFLKPSCFWQSHPFSTISESDTEISFAIKIKGGATHGLYKQVASLPGHTDIIKVVVEGPYGFSSPVSQYSETLLLASGNGIPGLYDHAMRLSRAGGHHSVKLVWVIRNWRSVSWMLEELKALKDTRVNVTVYVTKPKDTLDYNIDTVTLHSSLLSSEKNRELDYDGNDENLPTKVLASLKACLSHVVFEEGRPDIDCLIQEEITNAEGSVAVVACGHDSMVDTVRYSVAFHLGASQHRVDYFEELQVWS